MHNHALAARNHDTVRLRPTRSLRLVPPPAVRPQVLLVCDSALNAAAWCAALCEAEVVSVTHTEDLNRFDNQRFVLAVLDVAPARLVGALKALRAEHSDLPILVEANAVTNDLSFAGVLPQYRAMACGQNELIQLARRRLVGATPPPRKEVML